MISGKLGTLKPSGSYSKIGNEIPGAVPKSHISPKVLPTADNVGSIGAEVLRLIENDWKNLSMDLAQLGLTAVGLLDVAPPLQAGADVVNGGIDIARGHPWIGALSIASATPLAGLVSGLGLAGFRLLKVVWSGFKALGHTIFVLATVSAKAMFRFVVTRGGKLLTYLENTGKIIEGAKNIGNAIVENIVNLVKKIKEIDPQKFEQVNNKSYSNFGQKNGTDAWRNTQQQIQHKVQSEYGTYRVYPNTYGNMGKRNMGI